jgi:hypothetical protein
VRCKTCHYSLENLTGPPHRCPECGRAFDPNDASTVEWHHWLIGSWLFWFLLPLSPFGLLVLLFLWMLIFGGGD